MQQRDSSTTSGHGTTSHRHWLSCIGCRQQLECSANCVCSCTRLLSALHQITSRTCYNRHCTRLPQEHAKKSALHQITSRTCYNRHCTRLPQQHATIGTAPDYLNNMLQSALHQITSRTCYNWHCTRLPQEHATICVKTCVSVALRSATNNDMAVPRSRLKFGEHTFSIATPRAWNSNPADLHVTLNTATFKKNLKTFLFRESYSTFWFNSVNSFKLCCASLSIFIFGVLYFFVIGLVGLCCKPQPFVIIIIITMAFCIMRVVS